ncbi:LacI family DNA-binding transcriptional regulator [Arthrobacter sp. Bi83]|uniref:LacI family DNA-binding transcriptional regulator n=1 Tax=Arthrobacter sp. Bi83 TaxID=2822353 RepID=UPI001E57ABFF|nr:LacI family DNA-binding transcriptional regulator [Arthrobacter sp. Bi83]
MAVRSTRPPTPGIKDVARAAGVSHQPVSRVLNGLPHVATSTRARVESAVEELGYQRNTIARTLRTRSSRTTGVLTTNLAGYGQMQALLGVERVARSAGYFVSIASMSNTTMESTKTATRKVRSRTSSRSHRPYSPSERSKRPRAYCPSHPFGSCRMLLQRRAPGC